MELLEKLCQVLLSISINDLHMLALKLFGFVVSILLTVIAYFVKEQMKQQKEFNVNNTKEHKAINEKLTIANERLNQTRQNVTDIRNLDKRLDDHEIRINDLKNKIEKG